MLMGPVRPVYVVYLPKSILEKTKQVLDLPSVPPCNLTFSWNGIPLADKWKIFSTAGNSADLRAVERGTTDSLQGSDSSYKLSLRATHNSPLLDFTVPVSNRGWHLRFCLPKKQQMGFGV